MPKASDSDGAAGLAEYRRIEIELRKRVAGGQWPVGAMLPGRRDLARQYAVSLVTLDRAIGPLLADGTLRADDRRGTFVASRPAESGDRARTARRAGERPKDAGTVGIVASLGTATSGSNTRSSTSWNTFCPARAVRRSFWTAWAGPAGQWGWPRRSGPH